MILDELTRAAAQIIALTLIPFIAWLIAARKKRNFFRWIGLKKPKITSTAKFVCASAAVVAIAVAMSLVLDPLLPDGIQFANNRFAGKGLGALIPAIIFSFLGTALPEELLFRGFIGAKLSEKFGFAVGNLVQAILFGLLHGATLFGRLGVALPLSVIAFTGAFGWLAGYVNRQATGSVIPSVCLHGLSNVYATVLILF
jgi:membrane protease YdiL (CAAX protease family)